MRKTIELLSVVLFLFVGIVNRFRRRQPIAIEFEGADSAGARQLPQELWGVARAPCNLAGGDKISDFPCSGQG